ncbi:MAG TPA: hypothetical protein VGI11_16305 [Variovorax sp.]|jgi:uncharacterized protein (UPF0261 family)
MRALYKGLAIGIFGVMGALSANAQTDGSDYHPLQLNSPPSPDVDAGAVAAAHATGTEAVGQSTAAPAMSSQLTREEVYRGAVEAAHGGGGSSEAIGQSTGMAGITAGQPH